MTPRSAIFMAIVHMLVMLPLVRDLEYNIICKAVLSMLYDVDIEASACVLSSRYAAMLIDLCTIYNTIYVFMLGVCTSFSYVLS